MREHVIALAEANHVTLRWTRSWPGAHAYPGQRLAIVPEIRHPYDYMFALHEIGHCVDKLAFARNNDPGQYASVLVEGAAWAWASSQAKPSLTRHLRAADWNRVAYAWRTYVAGDAWRRDPV